VGQHARHDETKGTGSRKVHDGVKFGRMQNRLSQSDRQGSHRVNRDLRRRREAGFELRSQHRAIEIATNQHELVPCLALACILIQGETLGHEMENVAFVVLGDPKQALATVDILREALEEILKSLRGKGPFALKRKSLEPVRRQMIGSMLMPGVPLLALVT